MNEAVGKLLPHIFVFTNTLLTTTYMKMVCIEDGWLSGTQNFGETNRYLMKALCCNNNLSLCTGSLPLPVLSVLWTTTQAMASSEYINGYLYHRSRSDLGWFYDHNTVIKSTQIAAASKAVTMRM